MWGYFVGGTIISGLIWKIHSTAQKVESTKTTFDMVVTNPNATETLEVDRYTGSTFDLFCFKTVKMFQRSVFGGNSNTLPLTRGCCGINEYVVFNDKLYNIASDGSKAN